METRKAATALADINITPLIDVLLVLLIIFMVVTPVAQRALDASLPQEPKDDQTRSRPDTLVLEITNGGLLLNQQPVGSLDDLGQRLQSILDTRSDKTLFVRAAGDVGYGYLVAALDVARGVGVDRIGIMDSAEQPE